MKKRFTVLVTSSILDSFAAQDACTFVKQALDKGHFIEQVFFYMQGVEHANGYVGLTSGEFNAHDIWKDLHNEYGISLLVCITSAERRGVIDKQIAEGRQLFGHNLLFPFEQVGLGEFFSRLHTSDSLRQF